LQKHLRNRDFAIAICVALVGATAVTGYIAYLQNSGAEKMTLPDLSNILPNLSTSNSNQGATTAVVSSFTPVATSTHCDPTHPLSMVSASVGSYTGYGYSGTTPALFVKWSNCSSQSLAFDASTSSLAMTLLTYGQTSNESAMPAATVYGASHNVAAGATATVTLPINVQISPNAMIKFVKGSVTATDPVTGQGISVTATFTAYPG
jgi:hypothetical protein